MIAACVCKHCNRFSRLLARTFALEQKPAAPRANATDLQAQDARVHKVLFRWTDRGFDVADASVQLGELESNATVIVDYWAGWCGLPTRLTPAFERLQAFGGRLRFAKLKVDANPQAPSTRGVRGIPTTPVLCGGQADARPVDLESADRMRLQLERRLKAA